MEKYAEKFEKKLSKAYKIALEAWATAKREEDQEAEETWNYILETIGSITTFASAEMAGK